MNANQEKSKQLKNTDFIIKRNKWNSIDVKFLKDGKISFTITDYFSTKRIVQGEEIQNKRGFYSHLCPLGLALYNLIKEAEKSEDTSMKFQIGKFAFQQFFPDKYDLFF